MKHYVYLIVSLLFVALQSAVGQDEGKKQYYFKHFQDMEVFYKDGRTFKIPANYDFISGSFVFIDKEDGNQLKFFGEQEKIGSVKVGNRTFLPAKGGPIEIIQNDPVMLKVLYRPHIIDGGKKGAYGTSSSASATRQISHIPGDVGGAVKHLERNSDWVAEVDKIYIVTLNNKDKQFSGEKQFLKLFPKGKHDSIKKYIDDNKIDFTLISPVVELVGYATKL